MNIAKYIDEQINLLHQLGKTPEVILFPNERVKKIFINNLDVPLIHKDKEVEMKLTSYRGLKIEVIDSGFGTIVSGFSTTLGYVELPKWLQKFLQNEMSLHNQQFTMSLY